MLINSLETNMKFCRYFFGNFILAKKCLENFKLFSSQCKKKHLLMIMSLLTVLLAEYCYSGSSNTPEDEQYNHLSQPVTNSSETNSSEAKIPAAQNDHSEKTSTHKSFPLLFNKTSAQTNADGSKKEPVNAMDALSVSLGLIFILAIIFFLAWLMRKAGYSNMSGQGNLKIIATLNLGQKEKISLIEVGEQQLLVGITATQINTLHVLDEPLEAKYDPSGTKNNTEKNLFSSKLTELLKSKSVKQES